MPLCTSLEFLKLLSAATGMWTNWSPAKQCKLGDYGTVDEETGTFVPVGNVFNLGALDQGHNSSQSVEDHYHKYESPNMIVTGNTPSSDIHMLGVQWRVKGDLPAAALILLHPQSHELGGRDWLAKACDHILRGTLGKPEKSIVLVCEVVSCDAYALFLTNGGASTQLGVTLRKYMLPWSDTPTMWDVKGVSGTLKTGIGAKYTPLFRLCEVNTSGTFKERKPRSGRN